MKDITTDRICEPGNLVRDLLYLGRQTAFEVYIVAFSTFYKFKYLSCRQHSAKLGNF